MKKKLLGLLSPPTCQRDRPLWYLRNTLVTLIAIVILLSVTLSSCAADSPTGTPPTGNTAKGVAPTEFITMPSGVADISVTRQRMADMDYAFIESSWGLAAVNLTNDSLYNAWLNKQLY